MRAPEEAAAFQALALDAAVVVAFGQILPLEVLDAPRLGSFNLHASHLPRWRGAAPIQRAIMAGDAVTGVEVMRMTAGLDEGPVLGCVSAPIDAADTAGTLHDRLAAAGATLMVEVMTALARGETRERPQSADGATYARKLKAGETAIAWDRPAAQVDRQIRGLSPFPGAWFMAPSGRGPVRVKALLSRLEDGDGEPGAVRLLRAQREGKGAQEAAEFVRGFPLPAGSRL
jgi:methionyl-tRNA formyltransferase